MESAKKFEQKLARIMKAANISKEADLAKILEINQSSVAAARKRQQVPPGWIEKIAEKFAVNANWLFFGTGEAPFFKGIPGTAADYMHQTTGTATDYLKLHSARAGESTTSSKDVVFSSIVVPENDVDILLIPMVKARLSAGTGSLETDATSTRQYAFRSDFLHRKGNPDTMVLMRVAGDSMFPEIRDNDVVLIDQSKRDLLPSRIFAVGFDDAVYIKRIDMLPGKIILKSVNEEAYPPVELDVRGDYASKFRVIGQVLWCGREY
jgi:phage repressor protein C with HTH and peptisase S24 domain